MADKKPLRSSESNDFQKVEQDIGVLSTNFIKPIDEVRSLVKPAPSKVKGETQIDTSNYTESRCHAFYRMLGFPVVDKSGDNFYNSGYKSVATKDATSRIDDSWLDSKAYEVSVKRETRMTEFKEFYRERSFNAAMYTLIFCSVPNYEFLSFDEEKGPLEADQQNFTIEQREKFVHSFFNDNPNAFEKEFSASKLNLPAANLNANSVLKEVGIDSGNHILKPFVVDPTIVYDVQPEQLEICVPFLATRVDTRTSTSPEAYCKRPGIEFILLERLSPVSEDISFFKNVEKILEDDKGLPSSSDEADIKSVIEALSEDNDVQSAVSSEFENITNTDGLYLIKFVKLLKVVINRLNIATSKIREARNKINWIPLPAANGPQFGSEQGGTLWTANVSRVTELLNQILNLKIFLAANSEASQSVVQSQKDPIQATDYAIPGLSSAIKEKPVKKVKKSLSKVEGELNTLSTAALRAMADIELITGEVSGLGLVDIFSIYFALWAIDVKYLIGFLDSDALQRLNVNVTLANNPAVKEQTGEGASRPSIKECLLEFQKKLSLVLSFATKYAKTANKAQRKRYVQAEP